jgi:hypothetical protein
MRKFKEFMLNEADLKGSKGLPDDYLDKTDKELEVPSHGRIMGMIDKLMELVQQSKEISKGKEDELVNLAKDVLNEMYGELMNDIDLNVDIKNEDEMSDLMQEEDSDDDGDGEFNIDEIQDDIDKRKIINTIIQGEAKNTKQIFLMPDIKQKLEEITGSDLYFNVIKEITEIAHTLDNLPLPPKGMKPPKSQQSGISFVKWDGDKPKVNAFGLDFAMLIHEAVKGIYELIGAKGLTDDEKKDKFVSKQTSSFRDEKEEFKYGPKIAGDIRDFLNTLENINEYPNLREHFYGHIMGFNADKFLSLIKSILNKEESVKIKSQEILDNIISDLKEWDKDNIDYSDSDSEDDFKEWDKDNKDNIDYSDSDSDSEDDQVSSEDDQVSSEEDIDYSNLSKRDLQELVNDALDKGDFKKLSMLKEYL